jgi:cell division protein FtsZ
MGGGTGSGGLPVIARALRDKGILSIAVVTRPFSFEGKRCAAVAEAAIQRLKQDVDALIIIPNERLLEVVDEQASMTDAFAMINEGILSQSVRGLSDIITRPGHINIDYADIRTIMKDRGLAVMGTGKASGNGRARTAAIQAISSPLLENMSVVGARGVLCNITGGKDLGLREISEAASVVYEQAHEDANIIIGSVIDENLHDEVIVTIIATDFEPSTVQQPVKEEVKLEPMIAKEEPVVQCEPAVTIEPEPSFVKTSSAAKALEDRSEDRPLPLIKEMEILAAEEKNEFGKHKSDFFGKDDTFSCAIDSKDLDIPTFMRHRE